jgi:cytochrome c
MGAVLFCGGFALSASLLLARIHPFGDAGLYAAKSADTPILNQRSVPQEVRAILVEKCADCHSNQPARLSMATSRLSRG